MRPDPTPTVLEATARTLAALPGLGSVQIVRGDQLRLGDLLHHESDPITGIVREAQGTPWGCDEGDDEPPTGLTVQTMRGHTYRFGFTEPVLIVRLDDPSAPVCEDCRDCTALTHCGSPDCWALVDDLDAEINAAIGQRTVRLIAAALHPHGPVTHIGANPPSWSTPIPVEPLAVPPSPLEVFLARFGPGTQIGLQPTCRLRVGDILADCAGRIHHIRPVDPVPSDGGEHTIAYGTGYCDDIPDWRLHLVIRPAESGSACGCEEGDGLEACEGVEEHLFEETELLHALAATGLTLGTGPTAWDDPWQAAAREHRSRAPEVTPNATR